MKTQAATKGQGGQYGVVTVEFAVLALPLLILLFAIIEFSFLMHARSALDYSLTRAMNAVSENEIDPGVIDARLETELRALNISYASITGRIVNDNVGTARPEPLTQNVAPLAGQPGSGDCFIDINGNGVWDDAAVASRPAQRYEATVEYPLLFGTLLPYFTSETPQTPGALPLRATAVIRASAGGGDLVCIP